MQSDRAPDWRSRPRSAHAALGHGPRSELLAGELVYAREHLGRQLRTAMSWQTRALVNTYRLAISAWAMPSAPMSAFISRARAT